MSVIGTNVYRIGPGFTPSANAVANDMAPRTLQIMLTGTGVGVVCSVGYVLGE